MTLTQYLKWIHQTVENAATAYVTSFLGLLIASPGLDMDRVEAALVAAIPAALAVVKSMLAAGFGEKGTANIVREKL